MNDTECTYVNVLKFFSCVLNFKEEWLKKWKKIEELRVATTTTKNDDTINMYNMQHQSNIDLQSRHYYKHAQRYFYMFCVQELLLSNFFVYLCLHFTFIIFCIILYFISTTYDCDFHSFFCLCLLPSSVWSYMSDIKTTIL